MVGKDLYENLNKKLCRRSCGVIYKTVCRSLCKDFFWDIYNYENYRISHSKSIHLSMECYVEFLYIECIIHLRIFLQIIVSKTLHIFCTDFDTGFCQTCYHVFYRSFSTCLGELPLIGGKIL